MSLESKLSLPKSLYVCLRLLPFRQALHVPIRVRYNCRLPALKGKMILRSMPSHGPAFLFGFSDVTIFDKKHSRATLAVNGTIILEGTAQFGQGAKVSIGPNGMLVLGNRFNNTAETTIICNKRICFGNDVLVSWNTMFMDSDFHETFDTETGIQNESIGDIIIGNNVWVGSRSIILKKSVIPDGCIVGVGSLVNKVFGEQHCLLAGSPAIIKKRHITRVL